MIAQNIKKMKDNTSPGFEGIPPPPLKEIVEQISIPLAKVFNMSLEEEIEEWTGKTFAETQALTHNSKDWSRLVQR